MRTPRRLASLSPLALAASLPFAMGAKGDGCAAGSTSPAPDVTGLWAIDYDDRLGVKIAIGGAVYEEELGPDGGQVTIVHAGVPLTFELDCSRPDILCPSEAWPSTVEVAQRDLEHEHQMIVTLPTQVCSVPLREPAAAECGEGTGNPDCEPVCDGDLALRETEHFGVIGEAGASFRLYIGAGLATNGINCAALGWSLADADLATEGAGTEDWRATAMEDGLVTIGYAGGCLWLAQADMDPDLEAAVLAASVEFTTGFTGAPSGP